MYGCSNIGTTVVPQLILVWISPPISWLKYHCHVAWQWYAISEPRDIPNWTHYDIHPSRTPLPRTKSTEVQRLALYETADAPEVSSARARCMPVKARHILFMRGQLGTECRPNGYTQAYNRSTGLLYFFSCSTKNDCYNRTDCVPCV